MSNLVPRPVRDIIHYPLSIFSHKEEMKGGVGAFIVRASAQASARATIKATTRTALAILGMIGAHKIGGSMEITATLGGIMSLPALAIAGGSWLIHHGITGIIASVASGSFAALGYGLASCAGGWIMLENHDVIEFGLAEYIIRSITGSYIGYL